MWTEMTEGWDVTKNGPQTKVSQRGRFWSIGTHLFSFFKYRWRLQLKPDNNDIASQAGCVCFFSLLVFFLFFFFGWRGALQFLYKVRNMTNSTKCLSTAHHMTTERTTEVVKFFIYLHLQNRNYENPCWHHH